MIDVNSLCERFKLGDIDKIILTTYSYLLIGFFILFTIYEQNFLDLELHIQFFLMLGISFPISATFHGIFENFELSEEENDHTGFFYQGAVPNIFSSIWYISFFSLFYILKHMEITNYNNEFDQIIALIIILSGFVFAYILHKQQ